MHSLYIVRMAEMIYTHTRTASQMNIKQNMIYQTMSNVNRAGRYSGASLLGRVRKTHTHTPNSSKTSSEFNETLAHTIVMLTAARTKQEIQQKPHSPGKTEQSVAGQEKHIASMY